MKKTLFTCLALAAIATLQSCGEKLMDPAAVQAKVDSLAASKIEEANAAAITECETRMTTELKQKTDSLINAAQMAAAAQ